MSEMNNFAEVSKASSKKKMTFGQVPSTEESDSEESPQDIWKILIL